MSFNFNFGNQQQSSESGNHVQVDWDALNKHVIEAVGADKKKKSVVGVISGVIDLGEQEQEDAKMLWNGSEEDERKAIAEKPLTYFENGKDDKGNDVRYKRWPQKAVRSVAITVDFPQYMVNKGQFFGDENATELPFRMLLNGEFVLKGQKYSERGLGKIYPLKMFKRDDGKWSIKNNNTLYKMAVATDVIEDGEPFVPNQLGDLIGKHAMFEIRVHLKDGKYFDEYIKFVGMVPEGMNKPEIDPSVLYMVQFDGDNKEEWLKQLRVAIRNQMKRSPQYEGSKVKEQLDKIFTYGANSSSEASGDDNGSADDVPPKQANKSSKKAPADVKNAPPVATDFDDDIPFNRFMSGKLGYVV